MAKRLTEMESHELRGLLVRKREHLRGTIQALQVEEGTGELEDPLHAGSDVEDRADVAADQTAWDLQRMNELALRDVLAEVEHALAKFEDSTYGLCERCGQPIPLARLRIVPEARYDVRHQAEVESGKAAPVRLDSVGSA